MVVEAKNKESGVKNIWTQSASWVGLFAAVYLAVLPMADTIALRNIALLALLICVALQWTEIRHKAHVGIFVILWAVYLLAFPLIASEHQTAWISLGGQWGRGLLAMAAGTGAAVILSGRLAGSVFFLGAISALPILVHLVLFSARAVETLSVPWGYWGRETHHADLGYAAGHVVVLMAVSLLAGDRKYRGWSIGLIVASLLSTVLAQSRAGLVFAVLGGTFVFVLFYFLHSSQVKRHVLAMLIVVVGSLAGLAFKEDARWHMLSDKLAAGMLGDAIQIECEGTASIEAKILDSHGADVSSTQLIDAVRDGDGARVVLLRAGLQLALKHPWGSDGSRQAFKTLLREECLHPALVMAHAHNGWIDTMLAIGVTGAALYLGVLLELCRRACVSLKKDGIENQWALVLLTLSVFWIIRGFTDSVFRDHMLEMQGFVLTFALVASSNYAKLHIRGL
jgi:O-antigen ligase